jgi:hypothetical protein
MADGCGNTDLGPVWSVAAGDWLKVDFKISRRLGTLFREA